MSDQEPPTPKDDESPEQDSPPLQGSAKDDSTAPASNASPEEPPELNAPESEGAETSADEAGEPKAADPPIASSNVLGRGSLSENDEKTMGMLAHILGGVTCVLGPLIIWLIKKDESPFVNDQGKEAVNFQLSVLLAYLAAGLVGVVPVVGCLAALVIPAIGIASLIFGILGGLEANKGIIYRYPFALRLIS